MMGDAKASQLFQEYATATKGQRQLVWSRGLKTYSTLNKLTTATAPTTKTTKLKSLLARTKFTSQMSSGFLSDVKSYSLSYLT